MWYDIHRELRARVYCKGNQECINKPTMEDILCGICALKRWDTDEHMDECHIMSHMCFDLGLDFSGEDTDVNNFFVEWVYKYDIVKTMCCYCKQELETNEYLEMFKKHTEIDARLRYGIHYACQAYNYIDDTKYEELIDEDRLIHIEEMDKEQLKFVIRKLEKQVEWYEDEEYEGQLCGRELKSLIAYFKTRLQAQLQ